MRYAGTLDAAVLAGVVERGDDLVDVGEEVLARGDEDRVLGVRGDGRDAADRGAAVVALDRGVHERENGLGGHVLQLVHTAVEADLRVVLLQVNGSCGAVVLGRVVRGEGDETERPGCQAEKNSCGLVHVFFWVRGEGMCVGKTVRKL